MDKTVLVEAIEAALVDIWENDPPPVKIKKETDQVLSAEKIYDGIMAKQLPVPNPSEDGSDTPDPQSISAICKVAYIMEGPWWVTES